MKNIAVQNPSDPGPEIVYRGLAFCDNCGTDLQPREQFAGLCRKCQASLPSHRQGPREKRERPRRDRRHGGD